MLAASFLYGQKIFKAENLPYRTQLVPLAAIFVDLGKDDEMEGARQRIEAATGKTIRREPELFRPGVVA